MNRHERITGADRNLDSLSLRAAAEAVALIVAIAVIGALFGVV